MSSSNFLLLGGATLLLVLLPTAITAEFVLDTKGNPVRNGGAYAIYTANGGYVGFVPKNMSSPCSGSYVAQRFDRKTPDPVRLSQPTRQAFLLASTNLFADFGPNTGCKGQTGLWRLSFGDTGNLVVATNGVFGDESTKFKIEKVDSGPYDYKFIFCPEPTFLVYCGNIALKDNGVLGLNGTPLVVRFVPAKAKKEPGYIQL